jgi:calcium uptake protein 3, mitochondrial
MEKIFSNTWRDKRGLPQGEVAVSAKPQEQYVDDDQGLQRKHVVDTTLLLHFFGKKGREELKYEGFNRYAEIIMPSRFLN